EGASFDVGTKLLATVARSDRVPDRNVPGFLSVAVDPPNALLEDIRIPRDLRMDHQMTMVLKVDALGRCIRGNQNSNGREQRIGLERSALGCALGAFHARVDCHQSILTAKSFSGRDVHEPLLCRSVLRKNDHALSRPFVTGLDVFAK